MDSERHYCRNPKCRSKLKEPVSNAREAFCTRGCHASFYLHRCLVCEAAITQPKKGVRLLCKKARCRNDWRLKIGFGRWAPAIGRTNARNADETGISQWRIAAGQLNPSALHCATAPDGPDCRWEGGACRRLEANNKAMLREHFRKKAAECLVQPHHPPANILGCYRFPGAPIIDLSPLPEPLAQGAVLSDWKPVAAPLPDGVEPDDLAIPAFLRRT